MKKEDIIIIGRGGHAKVVIDIIESGKYYNIIGITDINASKGETFLGYPILGTDEVLPSFKLKGIKNLAIGIGGYKNNDLRKKVYHKMIEMNFNLPVLIHPSANVSKSSKVGDAVVIFSGVNINTEVIIGNNTIIATGSNIDHETTLGNHVLISAGVTIGGNVKIGNGVLCALGSNIISGLTIEENIVIGAGSVVVKNLSEKGVYMGCPAILKLF